MTKQNIPTPLRIKNIGGGVVGSAWLVPSAGVCSVTIEPEAQALATLTTASQCRKLARWLELVAESWDAGIGQEGV